MNIFLRLEEELNLKPIEMANKLNVSKSYYSMIRKGERSVSKNVALKLKDTFGIALDVSLGNAVHNEQTEADGS
ncbi:helix-turn-helix transcriptional regulator [Anaerospora sp.]|uniref:helix-turn-helix domain-containing protein n=1 Tax=Anaerospora sp. TaxID=1960278 RepID=UPI002897D1A6|nr:helix-turn-helix transcriptional regulator [Anaerospora sp.]